MIAGLAAQQALSRRPGSRTSRLPWRALVLLLALWLSACAGQRAAPDEPLVNTYWKLVWLPSAGVEVVANQREAHVVLNASGQRLAGATGCNSLMGHYRMQGQSLVLDRLATTERLCEQGMDTERALLAALHRVVQWRVTGQRLILLDHDGRVLARFQAVHLY